MLIWLRLTVSTPTLELIDSFTSAEIPDPQVDPLGYALVAEHMIHGPCGANNPNCSCMKNGICSKGYPKLFSEETKIDDQGFAVYKRPQNGRYVKKGNVDLDNRWVVPYNMTLLKKFQTHINVEFCNRTHVLKYLFKYVTKGPDCAKVYLERIRKGEDAPMDATTRSVNEVKEYLDCRYICEQDACWRVFDYNIHTHVPSVERLPVHLPNENYVTYREIDNLSAVVASERVKRTMLTEWFLANERYTQGNNLTYCEYPTLFTWDETNRVWNERKHGFKIGRLYFVHPSAGERYFLRMLLMIVKGAKSYEDIRAYEGIVYSTFKEACAARGLLGDDTEWLSAFNEAVTWGSSTQLRQLFVTMLLFCDVKDEFLLFENVWFYLGDDMKRQLKQTLRNPNFVLPLSELKDMILDEISILLNKHGVSIKDYNLPSKSEKASPFLTNRLIDDEMSYNLPELEMESAFLCSRLTSEQMQAFQQIVSCASDETLGFFFVSGFGGTGKTFLWNAIVSFLRAKRKIVLTVASSGVAALLLPGGRTAHSRFKIPLNIDDSTICDIKRGTMLAGLILKTSLVIWDEALITHRKCFETLDRTLRDIVGGQNPEAKDLVFGGKVIVLGGDLRQILPVIEGGTRAEIVNASITNSTLWRHVKVLKLTTNMRLLSTSLDPIVQCEIAKFSKWVLDIGEAKLPTEKRSTEDEPTWIEIPSEFLLHTEGDKIACIVSSVYSNLQANFSDALYLCKRAILTPTNEIADEVNSYVVSYSRREKRIPKL
ncbi:uncharacterized protein LOC133904848 isoform X1 [Phragmites australis]|uniref:uncharacterized protein LOC133904848 isoform X1 n=1 Tax=Phragmites australis TaxID=29695 RepID=UPI002D788643|nr:uncharacterized protein LOC133904848 isoform X1 [Phragmites australis]XP_062202427.1 uncharacterized protein LOC133904848 isoform X1 [Phragmites australis]XP_062202428.1 uncharacterized protein LOC133904848 isoform X1 [Phragmites australis]XP_062202429.1 uncharacterized protein LOC133904848 isoform X1 [Phragmites australis]XP_062202430.1 uncharacterized protein LOC133904848 isoform X1 [Phragmites australis]XP_062202431.1 uncharacterized protein LOC133904848 isoform X1 [Phragmites australis]